MTCRNCGHTIADNAIVCYKCGTPTAIPAAPAKTPVRGADSGRPIAWVAVVALIASLIVVVAATVRHWPWGYAAFACGAGGAAVVQLIRNRRRSPR